MKLAIEVENLGVSFAEKKIFSQVSFGVAAGEAVAIIGPNGAGKTSLLRCLSGLLKPASGSVRVFGKDVAKLSRAEVARRVGYVPQNFSLSVPYSVSQFLAFSRYAHRNSFQGLSQQDTEIIESALRTLQVDDFRERSMTTLSGGERQRVCIAAALAQSPDILLLDEPSAALDPSHQTAIGRVLRELKQEHGKAIIFVSHDVNAAFGVADRVIGMRDGRIRFDRMLDATFAARELEQLYGTEFSVFRGQDGDQYYFPARL